MSVDYQHWAEQIRRLDRALAALEPAAASVGLASPRGEEWYELLRHKLLPQVEAEPLLVVAVVGGTNIGKSALFNQLAGEVASGVSPLAAGTRHPVCLVPRGSDDPVMLTKLFEGFHLRPWSSPENALDRGDEHLLFWRVGANVPPRLLLLDTPDIDSDAPVNWQRADVIRQSADVLVAVLTQQKYNDAAVKRFFRQAAEADKPVIIVFNQVDLKDDRPYWPEWLRTFTSETGVSAELVYVVPYDRAAATSTTLPFYTVGSDGHAEPTGPVDLRAELARLHFDTIKIRTFRGAMARVLDAATGAPAYLARLRRASGEFAAAAQALSTTELARVRWPSLPPPLLVDEIRTWWDEHRKPWSRAVHGFYRTVGQGVMVPVRLAWRSAAGDPVDPIDSFRQRERQAIIETIEGMLDQLERLAQVGNEILQPRLRAILGGEARARLIAQVEAAHAALPAIDDDYRRYLREELDRWGRDNPGVVSFLRSMDHVAAVARPAITLSLVVSGAIMATGAVDHIAVQVAGHTAGQLATDAVITTGAGEAAATATGLGVKQAAALLFRNLQTHYAELRARWLAEWLERELLGNLLVDLRSGADVATGPAVSEVEAALTAIRSAHG